METLRTLLGLPVGASSFADGIDLLHLFVISVTMLASLYVFLAAGWFSVRSYRGEAAVAAVGTTRPASLWREGAIVAAILGMFLLWWVIGFVQYAKMADPPDDAMPIVVSAKQWMWKFTYPDGYSTNDILTVPVDRDVRVLLTSRDVIHSFYVPQFRLKHDVLPGRYAAAWFRATQVGAFDIYCAEYCGVNHSRMRGQVVVLSAADYERWLHREHETTGGDELALRGLGVATRRGCTSCHTLDGQPHVGPTWARLYGHTVDLTDGRHVVADDEYLTRSMMEPNHDVVAGFRPVMPSYEGLLSPGEVGALVELIRSVQTQPLAPGVVLPHLEVIPRDAGVASPDGGAP
jgi:cytochrome c oxidase subunit 2